MSNLFSDLEKATAEQKKTLAKTQPPKAKKEGRKKEVKPAIQRSAYKPTQKGTHILKSLSKDLSTEEIESLSFGLRKEAKVRINADVPTEWKDLLDDLAHQLKVGKYELLLYMIAVSLGKVQREETA